MVPIATNGVVWYFCASVCLFVGYACLNYAKTDEPIEMPFGGRLLRVQATVYSDTTWQIRWIDLYTGGDAFYRYRICSNLLSRALNAICKIGDMIICYRFC